MIVKRFRVPLTDYHRQRSGWEKVDAILVDLEIDDLRIAQWLGIRAHYSKKGVSKFMDGAVVCRIVGKEAL